MNVSKSELNRPQEIGSFDMTDEFINASFDTLDELHRSHSEWREPLLEIGLGRYMKFGDILDQYDRPQELGAQIYASFLGRVALDLRQLLGGRKSVRESMAVAYNPSIITTPPSRFDWHTDSFELKDAPIGIRYLTANRHPTVIQGIGYDTKPGYIYRMSNKHTEHKRPYFWDCSEDTPRALFAINF